MDIVEELVKKAKKSGADDADAVSIKSDSTSVTTRFGKLEGVERSESANIGLRVLIGKKQSIVSSADMSLRALDELVERAVAMAKIAPEDKYTSLADEKYLCNDIKNLDLFDATELSSDEMFELARRTEEAALAVEGITNTEGADASCGTTTVSLATSNGFSGEYKTSIFAISTSVLAGQGTHMERDYEFVSKRYFKDIENPEEIGESAAYKAIKRLNPQRAATSVVPVVFEPRVAKSLLGAFASAVNGAAVARGASFLKNNMGQEIFSKGVNIINDPHIMRGPGSKPYDAEGVANKKMSLVEDGALENWLLDVRSARQLGLETNGCASRGISSVPSPSSSNIYMENGEHSKEELLSDIKSGFFVTETFGMGVNIVTGDYSQGASGFWIENGKISYPVSEVTIAGSLADMFKAMIPANDLEFKYNTNSPTLFIEKMTVAGR